MLLEKLSNQLKKINDNNHILKIFCLKFLKVKEFLYVFYFILNEQHIIFKNAFLRFTVILIIQPSYISL